MIIYNANFVKLELKIINVKYYLIKFIKNGKSEQFYAMTYKDKPNKFMIFKHEIEINKILIASEMFNVEYDSFNNVIYELNNVGRLKLL